VEYAKTNHPFAAPFVLFFYSACHQFDPGGRLSLLLSAV
jgi:hypothetical protein